MNHWLVRMLGAKWQGESQPCHKQPLNCIMVGLDVPHGESFFEWTVTLGQYAIANFMMNSVFLFSIFTWEPFFIWEKPQKVFLGSNAHFLESGLDFF